MPSKARRAAAPPERRGAPDRRQRLRADCGACFALCCVAPAFAASADFAADKPAGQPCRNLRADFRCGIHDRLRPEGFPGCTVYDCFGAGQQVAQVTFGGRDWRREPGLARSMFDAFAVMRQLHEFLWYLAEALTLPAARPIHGELRRAYQDVDERTRLRPDALAELDLAVLGRRADDLLRQASELVRAGFRRGHSGPGGPGGRRIGPRADLVGADLRRVDLVGRDLRGAYLIGADLRGADLRGADLIGADLRGARLDGADLRGSIFLTQPQVDAARGDAGTRLPPPLRRPAHWGRG